MDSFNFSPIGFFKSPHINKYDAPRQSTEAEGTVEGVVELVKGFNLEQGLKGLGGFERLWIIYKFHKNENWKPLTETPRATEKQGVFATRSPYRPNPIGMSCVKLLKIEGNKIFVEGHDILDGAPVLDIKPYIPHCDSFKVKNDSWVEEEESKEVLFSEESKKQIDWFQKNGVDSIQGFIKDQLGKDPLNQKKKRVKKLERKTWCLSYRTWRVNFNCDPETLQCEVLKIYSGYTPKELMDSVDKYGDKRIHMQFLIKFAT